MTTTQAAEPRAGALLRRWRQRRRLSQLDLSIAADVSTRHLSFLETGRAAPSRDMVLHLADHLEVPLRERNALLLAAGYAPVYHESGLDGPGMSATLAALRGVLAGHEPNPAILVDRQWNLVDANTAATVLMEGVAPELLEPPVNVLRASLHPDGMASRIVNLREWRAHVLHRLRREADLLGSDDLDALYEELAAYPYDDGGAGDAPAGPVPEVAVTLRLRHPRGELTFLSLVSTFGTPVDVTMDELVLETFLPADDATIRFLADLAG
ncbi:MAG TPA: helix-turn-helix transcriptional regulator [Streptosporangiaceae bacterium]